MHCEHCHIHPTPAEQEQRKAMAEAIVARMQMITRRFAAPLPAEPPGLRDHSGDPQADQTDTEAGV